MNTTSEQFKISYETETAVSGENSCVSIWMLDECTFVRCGEIWRLKMCNQKRLKVKSLHFTFLLCASLRVLIVVHERVISKASNVTVDLLK